MGICSCCTPCKAQPIVPQDGYGNFPWNATTPTSPAARVAQLGQPKRATTNGVLPPAMVNQPGGFADEFGLGSDGLLPSERNSIAVYEKSNRSTVHISTSTIELDAFLQVSMRGGGGSGSILDREGRILTNQHVIEGAREISVRLANGSSYPAELVGQDKLTDIAVLQINAPPNLLVPIEWSENKHLIVGQRIYAIGNPFGLERTLSAGMISSLNREFSEEGRIMRSLIQIDASINQGNSGGPLLNTRGQLIGMNTAIMSSDGDSAGVGFAIPISTLARIVPQLIQSGKVLRASIGLRRVYETEKGLLVVAVLENGPADLAGLQGFGIATKTYQQGPYTYQQQSLDTSRADLILSIDGQGVKTAEEMLSIIESKRPGDQVMLTIIRNKQRKQLPVVLGQSQ